MIVGAHKAGTTSLKEYLGTHPAAVTHRRPDMSYFTSDREFARGYEKAWATYFASPVRESSGNATVVAKHASLYAQPKSLPRLNEHNPRCRLILSLRDPVERSFSSYLHVIRRSGTRLPEFTQLVDELLAPPSHEASDWRFRFVLFIQYGHYVDYVRALMSEFGAERIRLVILEDLQREPLAQLQALATWCSLDPQLLPHPSERHNAFAGYRSLGLARFQKRILNESNPAKRALKSVLPPTIYGRVGEAMRALNRRDAARPELPAEARARLEQHYAPYNAELEELLGRPLPWGKPASGRESPHPDASNEFGSGPTVRQGAERVG